MKKGKAVLMATLLCALAGQSTADSLNFFNQPMSRMDFAVYAMGQRASKLIRDVILESHLETYASHGEVSYVASPLEIRVYGQVWGLSEKDSSAETCRSILTRYAKKMTPSDAFWKQLGPSASDVISITEQPGQQMAQYFVYEVFLDELPVNYDKRIKCSLKESEI